MAYPSSFHRLVLIGTAFGDIFNTSLSVVPTLATPTGEPNDALLDAVWTFVQSWWADGTATGPRISFTHRLTSIKLNRIGTDGKYEDAVTHQRVHASTGIAGGFNGAVPVPQTAAVITLRTDVERGRASKGRMFLPPVDGYITPDQTTGQVTTAKALQLATAGRGLVVGINAAYDSVAGFGAGAVGVASGIGAGQFRPVTAVSAGRVIDTMRSRRSALREDPQKVNIAP